MTCVQRYFLRQLFTIKQQYPKQIWNHNYQSIQKLLKLDIVSTPWWNKTVRLRRGLAVKDNLCWLILEEENIHWN